MAGCASPDLDDPETLKRILGEAQVGAGVKTGWRKIAHANGKVSSLSHFKDGRLDGLQTGWHENGKKRVQCRYKDGEKDGLWTVWDENGRKEFEFCWKDDKRVGDWILYLVDGTKDYHVTYKDGGRVETIISPSTPSVPSCPRPETEPKELGKTLTAALAAIPEEYRKELAAMPEEYRASVLAIVKDSPFLKREPVRLDVARSVLMRVISGVRERLQADRQQHENRVRSALRRALDEAEEAVMAFWKELAFGESLEEQRKAKEDAQKRYLEKRQAEEKAAIPYGGLLVLNRIRGAKERGDTTLFLRERRITDVTPLAELTKLTELNIRETRVTDLAPLAGLTNLTTLRIEENILSNIMPLAGLTNLRELDLYYTQTTDVTPLAGLTELTKLDIRGNKITDLTPLAGLTKLTKLFAASNKITDLTPLAGLTNLTKLHLEDNPIPLDQMAMLRKALPNCKIYFMRPFRP